MIRVIDHMKVEMNDEEFSQYNVLVKQLGEEEFKGLLKTDENGIITMISPIKPVSWLVLHFLQQVQINQHLRENDSKIEWLVQEIKQLKNRMNKK